MNDYQATALHIRRVILQTLEHAYQPFAAWSDLQKLGLILGLITFIGVITSPPLQHRNGRGQSAGEKFMTATSTLLACGFVVGLVAFDGA